MYVVNVDIKLCRRMPTSATPVMSEDICKKTSGLVVSNLSRLVDSDPTNVVPSSSVSYKSITHPNISESEIH